ncbi:MAG: 5-nitroimidazole antibiotic resistance protein [Muribaculaceae bacterium]|nr:5-nitroimidazole antibiotic resistance protein [Muribaculaceae bacterium]
MEQKMRRFKQQLAIDYAVKILDNCTNGILSLVDTDGAPYGVPISYVYDGHNHLYLHCAASGRKIGCIKADSRCSFCIVSQDSIVPEEFTTYFRSVIVTGKIKILTDSEEIRHGLILLSDKYCPGIDPTKEIDTFINTVKVLRIDIDSITGKESIELVRQRQQSNS